MKTTREKSKKILGGVMIILLMLTWFNYGFAKEEEPWKKEIHVPFITCMTGAIASWGKVLWYGGQIAEEEINGKGGVNGMKFVLDVSDDGSDPAQSAILVRKVEPMALAILGPHNSATAETGLPVGNSLKVPILACCAAKTSIATESRPWTFINLMPVDVLSIKGVELFLKKEVAVKTAVVLVDKEDPSATLQAISCIKGLKGKGITVLEEITTYRRDIDPAPVVTRIKNLNPDAIIIATLPELGGSFIVEIGRQGLRKKILCAQASWTPDLIRVAGSAGEGIYGIAQMWPSDPKLKAFADKCKKKSGGPPPNICSFTGYELTWFLAQAMQTAHITNNPKKRKEEKEKLLSVIQTMERDGIYGKWRFGRDGVASGEAHLLKIQDGKEIEVK